MCFWFVSVGFRLIKTGFPPHRPRLALRRYSREAGRRSERQRRLPTIHITFFSSPNNYHDMNTSGAARRHRSGPRCQTHRGRTHATTSTPSPRPRPIMFGNLHITVFHGVSSWAERVQFRCRAPSRARGANFGVISAGPAATPGPFQAGGTAARQASAPRIPPPGPQRPAPVLARPCATASATRRPSRVDGRAARTGFLPSPRAAGALAVVSEASAARPTPGRCRARAAAAHAPSSGLAAAPRRRGAAA